MRSYRNRRYYRTYRGRAGFADMIIELLSALVYLFIKGLFKLIRFIWASFRNSQIRPIRVNPFVPTTHDDVKNESRYALKDNLMTPNEGSFLKTLQDAVGDNYRIYPQVALSRIVEVKDSSYSYVNYKDFNKISAKSIDFLLCDKDNRPQIAVELDDKTHFLPSRIRRDIFLDELFHGVGLRIAHIPSPFIHGSEELRKLIFRQ